MSSARAGNLLTQLSQVPDPRGRKGRRHPLSAMLTAVVCGLLCGNRGYSALVEWLHDLPVDVWHWMGYTRRPHKLDCFRDLLMKLDPAHLERLLSEWISATLEISAETLSAVSLDGKTLCATLRPFARAVHLLAAVPNASYLEVHGFGLQQYIRHPLQIEHGEAIAPERPGHGVEFDWEALAQFRQKI